MKKNFEKLVHECGFYPAHHNPQAFERELEFLLEQVVLDTLTIIKDYQYDNTHCDWEWGYNCALGSLEDLIREHWEVHSE